ncbi:hypothetical protein O7605_31640 [Verrucosispora sp. WMMA2121]|uniref:hypothetical protein n=1 Tax=Verrucosispora sp. WMMA2121 TaxID=3015164 RepID=UPI0022B65D3A|nr:hypothetical protein [Verrucosispora sp. WMMA2121]MCZ7423789.1 hypothetical protein [Verrucosispora sp. WMMA2121]MCZ7424069.1 hypothetical protein [Verrucosispora sp. WMMA2121]
MPAIISAVAASLAAVLAGVNLVVSGRREHAKWARETLVEVLVDFVDASFESKDAVKHAIREGKPEVWPPVDDACHRAQAKAAERRMRTMQSRLRLLAAPRVVDAAQHLRIETKRYLALLDSPLRDALERDLQMRQNLWTLRQKFLNEAKVALALPRPWRRVPKTTPSEGLGRPSDADLRARATAITDE